MNFVNNDVKIIKNGMYKDKPICLITINNETKIQYMILLNCNEKSGDGYIYDDIENAMKDFNLLLNGIDLDEKDNFI